MPQHIRVGKNFWSGIPLQRITAKIENKDLIKQKNFCKAEETIK